MVKSDFAVLLYYKYTDIQNPEEVRDAQRYVCESLHLKGRVIVAKEGINGTIEGTGENTEKYIKAMQKLNYFKDINFKKSIGSGKAFPKLKVKVRPEIVRSGMPDLNPNTVSGKYISASKLHQWFEEKKEFYIIDMRNDYEYVSGFFENSIFSGIHNFYDLPESLSKFENLKGKTIVTVCTGGIRCEKASGFLVSNGISDVYQLKDGIQTYMEKYPNQHFKGKLYVFDNRLTLGENVVGKCMHCGRPSDSYVNCAFDFCHYHYICCIGCRDQGTNLAFCKKECKQKWLAY